MDKERRKGITELIQKREQELKMVNWFYKAYKQLDLGVSGPNDMELQTRVSSKMAQLEISIRDHKKLLK